MSSTPPYMRPTDLREALSLLREIPDLRIVAGSTDHFPARVAAAPREPLLDVTGIQGLRGISHQGGSLRIGAATPWSEIRDADLPAAYDGLRSAAGEVGGAQIQNQGSIAGNLCNASPAADGIPPLLTLNADVILAGPEGERRMRLSDFLTGYRQTAIEHGEMLVAVEIPDMPESSQGAFLKLGARHYLVISIVMVAGIFIPDDQGRVASAAVSIGACSPVALRLPALEAELVGREINPDLSGILKPSHLEDLSPIDDVRAPASYRREAAEVLTRRLIASLGETMQGSAKNQGAA